jgi:hypothetical protein
VGLLVPIFICQFGSGSVRTEIVRYGPLSLNDLISPLRLESVRLVGYFEFQGSPTVGVYKAARRCFVALGKTGGMSRHVDDIACTYYTFFTQWIRFSVQRSSLSVNAEYQAKQLGVFSTILMT